MMNAEPQTEHRWLESLVGEWTFETGRVDDDQHVGVRASGPSS
jgi:hypothetical protein